MNWNAFKRLFHYLGRYKLRLILVMIAAVLSTLFTVLTPAVTGGITSELYDGVASGSFDWETIVWLLVTLIALYLVAQLFAILQSFSMTKLTACVMETLRGDIDRKMHHLKLDYYDSHTQGEILSTITNDVDTVNNALSQNPTQIVTQVVTAVGILVMMFTTSPILAAIAVVMVPVSLLASLGVMKTGAIHYARQQELLGQLNGYIEEMIEGQKVIKVFNHEDAAKAGFAGLNEAYRDAATKAQAYAGAMMPAMGNLSHINYAITCCVGGLLAIRSGDLGGLAAFLQYTKQVSQPITQISQQVNTILSAVAGAERVFEIMETEPEVDEGKVTLERVKENADGTLSKADYDTGAWAWKKPDGTLVPLRGDVRFDHVVFGYDDRKIILHDISLFAKPGQKIAFVGSTGAGKTTITSLINRFYEIQSGTITYDGIDVRDIQKDSLRRSLGVVLQDTHLFTGTVADNIRYGRLDATDEEVEAAARLAGADGFIRHLPDGYQTVLTSEGGSLSQGERQLLNIARAACANPPVLILDEATSSIDTRTEKLIEKGMDRLMAGRTVFVIAHRLSTVRNSKAIMVLEQGSIIERGDHENLLAQHGRYYQLYTGQAELA